MHRSRENQVTDFLYPHSFPLRRHSTQRRYPIQPHTKDENVLNTMYDNIRMVHQERVTISTPHFVKALRYLHDKRLPAQLITPKILLSLILNMNLILKQYKFHVSLKKWSFNKYYAKISPSTNIGPHSLIISLKIPVDIKQTNVEMQYNDNNDHWYASDQKPNDHHPVVPIAPIEFTIYSQFVIAATSIMVAVAQIIILTIIIKRFVPA